MLAAMRSDRATIFALSSGRPPAMIVMVRGRRKEQAQQA